MDALFAEIDKYAKTKKIEVDADPAKPRAPSGCQRIEQEENAGKLTPERLAKLEAEKAPRRRRRDGRGAQASPRRGRLAHRRAPLHPRLGAWSRSARRAARAATPGGRCRPSRWSRSCPPRSSLTRTARSGYLPGPGRRGGARGGGGMGVAAARPLERGVPIAVRTFSHTEGVETTYWLGDLPRPRARARRSLGGPARPGRRRDRGRQGRRVGSRSWAALQLDQRRARDRPEPAGIRCRARLAGWLERRLRRRPGGRPRAARARD